MALFFNKNLPRRWGGLVVVQQNGSNSNSTNGNIPINIGSGTLNIPIGSTKTITIGGNVPNIGNAQNIGSGNGTVPGSTPTAWNNPTIWNTTIPVNIFNWTGVIPAQKYIDAPLRIGQIWQYRTNPSHPWNTLPIPGSVDNQSILNQVDFAVQIDEIDTKHARFTFIKSNGTNPFCQGQNSALLKFFDDNQYFRLIIDAEPTKEVKYGVHCGKCGKYCEYAEFSSNFKCWPCKNGF